MVIVSHDAMQRYPVLPTDGNQSNQFYYVASTQQQPSQKRTWTQRFKISKSEKSLQPSVTDFSTDFQGNNTLSRSMKYAEPWLYGTVRGIPVRPVHRQTIFNPIPAEVAVVVCSCPEYLTGTKREIKKASICKKCKGSRLPLAPIAGTVRITSTVPIIHKSRGSAGTMRNLPTTSTSKSRPSILDPQNDPYDLMRRTRLLSPENKFSSKSSDISVYSIHAKSTSPTRGRSRSKLKSNLPPLLPVVNSEIVPVKSNRNKSINQDCWLDTTEPDTSGRRSILHCSVNPYDLISNNKLMHMNEFSPHKDDDDIFNSGHYQTGTISKSAVKTVNYSNVKAIAGQRISLGDENMKPTSSLITQISENSKNNIASTKKTISKGSEMENEKLKPTKLQQLQQQQLQKRNSYVKNETKFTKKDNLMDTKQQQPKRPPRRSKHDTSTIDGIHDVSTSSTSTSIKMTNESNDTMDRKCTVLSSSSLSSTKSSSTSSSSSLLKPQISLDVVSSQKQGGIKSILKRPTSLISSPTVSVILGVEKNNKNCIDDTIVGNDSLTVSNNDKSTNVKDETKCNDKTIGSQFYLPIPAAPTARKKVQFMVEDKIILDELEENKIFKENENMTKVVTIVPTIATTISDGTAGMVKSKIMRPNGQVRMNLVSVIQQQDKQHEVSELLQNEKKSDTEVIIGGNSNGTSDGIKEISKNEQSSNYIVENNTFRKLNGTQIENSSTLMVNGKSVLSSSSSLLTLSNRNVKYCDSNSYDEKCLLAIKNGDDIDEGKQLLLADNNEDDESTFQSSVSKRQLSSLRRTYSDRRSNTTTIILNFNDTMALRAKNTRLDSRDLFSDNKQDDQQQLLSRNQNNTNNSNDEEEYKEYQNQGKSNEIEKQQQERDQKQEQSVLKMKNDFSVNTMAHIKVNNNEKSSENKLNEECSRKYENESFQTIFSQQQQSNHQLPQGAKLLGFFKEQQNQQNKNKNSSLPNDCIFMVKNKNDSNISSGWDEENSTRNVDNIRKDYSTQQNSVMTEENCIGIRIISDNIRRNDASGNSVGVVNNITKLEDYQQNKQNSNHFQFQKCNIVEEQTHRGKNNDEEKYEKIKIMKDKEKEKILQAQNEILNGSRLFANIKRNQNIVKCNNNSQRTVVRVAPFNKTSSEIHRLKIQHQDDNNIVDDNNIICQKKTSILINGDDCYSTVNVNNDTPIYQSSVVVTDGPKNSIPSIISTPSSSSSFLQPLIHSATATTNTVTISVSNYSKNDDKKLCTLEEEITYKNNKMNTLHNQNVTKSVISVVNEKDARNSNMMVETTTLRNDKIDNSDNSNKNNSGNNIGSNNSNLAKGVRTLITLNYNNKSVDSKKDEDKNNDEKQSDNKINEVFSHEEELVKILRNPVEAVKRNLVPHIFGKSDSIELDCKIKNQSGICDTMSFKQDKNSFIGKLLQDSTLNQLAKGIDNDVIIKLIENSLKRLKDNRNNLDTSEAKESDEITKLINTCLQKIKEERHKMELSSLFSVKKKLDDAIAEEQESQSNRGSISSGNSYSSANYELFDFENNESDCYQSCSSEITADDDSTTNPLTRHKFYQMLVDATLSEIEISANNEDDHHYESIRVNSDPIYEEINDVPPPLPLSPPPIIDLELEKKNSRSMFEGASKYDILSYLVDAKERGLVREESYEYNFSNTSDIIIEEEIDTLSDLKNKKQTKLTNNCIISSSKTSDSFKDTNSFIENSKNSSTITSSPSSSSSMSSAKSNQQHYQNQERRPTSDIERNDSGVGSETSKSSRSKYQNSTFSTTPSFLSNSDCILDKNSPIHLCEDCDGPVETQMTDSGVMYAPLVCRKCGKKRAERKEIITEIVETEEKYGRDLQIILDEFCKPMLVAGLLTQEQLSAIFLNTEDLLENNQTLAERMRDALDIALEQGDDDLLTVNVGKIFLECTTMLHAFESYCIRQAGASLLLANLEKEKELLRIFLKVSQMENAVLRRMNLNSFLMVPVQRVTKYPLLLARLYKVTPPHLEGRELLKQAQEKIELHLNHMNQEAKDVPTKLWRRISSSSPNRRASCEIDMINIKLRKMSIDILEWNHDEVRFAMEGKLLFTQPTDSNWKKGRTIKLTPVNALLVTNGKPSTNYKAEKVLSDRLNFPKHTGIREAALLLVKEKCGRHTLVREPLYLDRCVICTESDWEDYFEVHEISSKDTFILKAEDGVRSKQWYKQLQYHAQGMGTWRKRRNALANIMINGMLSRT